MYPAGMYITNVINYFYIYHRLLSAPKTLKASVNVFTLLVRLQKRVGKPRYQYEKLFAHVLAILWMDLVCLVFPQLNVKPTLKENQDRQLGIMTLIIIKLNRDSQKVRTVFDGFQAVQDYDFGRFVFAK